MNFSNRLCGRSRTPKTISAPTMYALTTTRISTRSQRGTFVRHASMKASIRLNGSVFQKAKAFYRAIHHVFRFHYA